MSFILLELVSQRENTRGSLLLSLVINVCVEKFCKVNVKRHGKRYF